MQLSAEFADDVKKAWGNPERVADVGIGETFAHEDKIGLDHDDQVENAKRIGILAGKTASQNPEAFIEGFIALFPEE